MKKVKQLLILFTLASLLILTLLPSTALAQSTGNFNLQISPLPIELNAKPGTTVSSDLRVRNAGSQTEQLKAVLKTFTVEGPNGKIVFHDPGPTDDFVKWIKLTPTVFSAPAGQWQTVKMTVSLPPTAAFGYYWAVQFERANPAKAEPGAAKLEGAVAIFTLLNAEHPGAVRKAEITSFTADRKSYEFLPATFNVRMHNSGNVHFVPTGNIFIKRGKSQVATIPVNSSGGNVLPDSNRVFEAAWEDGFPAYVNTTADGQLVRDKDGKPKKHLSWNLGNVTKLRFGHYTADLVMVYNDGSREVPVTATLSFWVVPWRLILYAIVILMIPALLVYIFMRWRFKKRLAKERVKAGRHA